MVATYSNKAPIIQYHPHLICNVCLIQSTKPDLVFAEMEITAQSLSHFSASPHLFHSKASSSLVASTTSLPFRYCTKNILTLHPQVLGVRIKTKQQRSLGVGPICTSKTETPPPPDVSERWLLEPVGMWCQFYLLLVLPKIIKTPPILHCLFSL